MTEPVFRVLPDLDQPSGFVASRFS